MWQAFVWVRGEMGKKSVLNSICLNFLCNEREGRLMKYPQIHPVSFLLNQQLNSNVLPRQRKGNSKIKFPYVAKETQAAFWWWAMIFWQFNCYWSLCIRLHFDSPPDSKSFNYAGVHTMFGINKKYSLNRGVWQLHNNIKFHNSPSWMS